MRALLLTCAALLFLALADLPIGYYTFLRILITVSAIIVILPEIKKGVNGWIIAFGLIAIFFNPVWPIYLYDKGDWMLPDILAAIVFIIRAIFETVKPKLEKNEY